MIYLKHEKIIFLNILKEMFTYISNKKMKLPELKSLLVQHNVKGGTHLNKPELIDLLVSKGILTPDYSEKVYRKKEEYQKEYQKGYWKEYRKGRKSKCCQEGAYDRLRYIRNQPKRVEILDRETGDVCVYPSMYKAAKAHGQSARIIFDYNGKVWRKRYEIKVCEKEIDI